MSVAWSGVTRSIVLSRFTRLDDMGVVAGAGGGGCRGVRMGSFFPGLLKAGEVDVERCLFAAVVAGEGGHWMGVGGGEG